MKSEILRALSVMCKSALTLSLPMWYGFLAIATPPGAATWLLWTAGMILGWKWIDIMKWAVKDSDGSP